MMRVWKWPLQEKLGGSTGSLLLPEDGIGKLRGLRGAHGGGGRR